MSSHHRTELGSWTAWVALSQSQNVAIALAPAGQPEMQGRSLAGCALSAQGREVGVRAAMLVAPPEQVSHNRSLASSAIDRALPPDAYRSSLAGDRPVASQKCCK